MHEMPLLETDTFSPVSVVTKTFLLDEEQARGELEGDNCFLSHIPPLSIMVPR